MKTLTITDLKISSLSASNGASNHKQPAHVLSRVDMQGVRGGRAIAVQVDGRPGGVVDDFQLEFDIFKGNIGVKVV